MIGSGPFEEAYAQRIMETRLGRLSEAERTEAFALMETLKNPASGEPTAALAHFGAMMSKADMYDALPHKSEALEVQGSVYQSVWPEAAKLRSSGELLALGKDIQCPVVVIHGKYDPHSYEGVNDPLSGVLKDFRFILLDECGHEPWFERRARERFYQVLRDEVGRSPSSG